MIFMSLTHRPDDPGSSLEAGRGPDEENERDTARVGEEETAERGAVSGCCVTG